MTQPRAAARRVAIFTDETGWHTRQLQAALRGQGASGRCIDLADCRIDTAASAHGLRFPSFGTRLPDAALVRGIAGGSFEQVSVRLGVLHALQALGVPVYNEARAIERSVDKSMTSLLLHAAGVPTPPAWAMESPAQAAALVQHEAAARRSLVLKPLFGSQGKGLQRLGWVDGRVLPLPPLAGDYGGLAYLQRFIAPLGDPGHDYRVLVIGGRAVTAMRRVSRHWVHNIAQGARAEPTLLTRPLARLAERAAAVLQMDYAGVDILPDAQGGLQVIEVNGVAAWAALQKVTPFSIAARLVADLLERKCASGTVPVTRPVAGLPGLPLRR